MHVLRVLLVLFCLPVLLWSGDRPNVILIYTDDHGWPDIGAASIYDDLKTPHLDALAASGVHATNGYSSAPQCVPSRAGLLSGRFQNRFGVESNGTSLEGFNAQETVAERLRKAGYATGQIGKWHLGPGPKIPEHGFTDVYAKNANRPCSANFTLDGKTVPMQTVDDGLYHLDAASEAALTFIRRHEDEPFFLYLAYRAPHVPLDAPEKYLSRFPGDMPERRRQALAMISAMDDGVGKIRAELKSRNLLEKTVIFFIGDNGAPLKIHKIDAPGGGPGWDGSLNEPMNGEKGMLTEGGIRVPFLISWPGTIPGGRVYEEPIIALDATATAIALAGLPIDDLDGVNLVPYLKGEKKGAPHEFLTWRWVAQAAVRHGDFKLLKGGSREYLFDLRADPGEHHNVISKFPDMARTLRDHLTAWTGELQPPGIAAGTMSRTWEDYYDHYLDGKPVSPKSTRKSDPARARGWLARGATLQSRDTGLAVKPAGKQKRPFLVTNDFTVKDPFEVQVRLKATRPGRLGIAWRLHDQKDFPAQQITHTTIAESDQFQDAKVLVPISGKAIHFRLFLPDGESLIEKISFSKGGGKERTWNFKVKE